MSRTPDPPRTRRPRRAAPAPSPAGAEAFREEFDEPLAEVLRMDGWRSGRDLGEEYRRIEEEVARAIARETETQKDLRKTVFGLLAEAPSAPPGAGLHRVLAEELIATQHGLLFSGAVEACDGGSQVHDSLALSVYQVGVSLVSYRGDGDCWQQRLYRREIRRRQPNPVEAVFDLIERRSGRGGLHSNDGDPLSELARRGLMTYAERAVLAGRATAPWRMGHGSPAPLELIAAYFSDLVIESIKVIRKLVEFGRFVFVASEPADRGLLTIGQALHPREYAIIGRLNDRVDRHLEDWAPAHAPTVDTRWDGEELTARQWVQRFRDEVAPQVVYGMYRATELGPPHLFYAHADHAGTAAHIALADSVFQEQRGFPQLIDLADRACKMVYGGGSLQEMAASAYAAANVPYRYGSERETRQ